MTADAVAAALDDARFDARQASRHEHLADDTRELTEWERIDQLLAAAGSGAVYDPNADDVARAELAADAAAAAAREADLREQVRIEGRADELQALRELGTLVHRTPRGRRSGAGPAHPPRRRRPDRRRRLVRARPGLYADPAARQAATDLLPRPIPTHAALLATLARLQPGTDVDVDQLAFAGRLAAADPEAAADLVAFLTRAAGRAS
jgi:hypothetical protein